MKNLQKLVLKKCIKDREMWIDFLSVTKYLLESQVVSVRNNINTLKDTIASLTAPAPAPAPAPTPTPTTTTTIKVIYSLKKVGKNFDIIKNGEVFKEDIPARKAAAFLRYYEEEQLKAEKVWELLDTTTTATSKRDIKIVQLHGCSDYNIKIGSLFVARDNSLVKSNDNLLNFVSVSDAENYIKTGV